MKLEQQNEIHCYRHQKTHSSQSFVWSTSNIRSNMTDDSLVIKLKTSKKQDLSAKHKCWPPRQSISEATQTYIQLSSMLNWLKCPYEAISRTSYWPCPVIWSVVSTCVHVWSRQLSPPDLLGNETSIPASSALRGFPSADIDPSSIGTLV